MKKKSNTKAGRPPTYNPPPAEQACERCGRPLRAFGPGQYNAPRGTTGATWRYACSGLHKKGAEHCGYTVTLPVPRRESAIPVLAVELREIAKGWPAGKAVVEMVARAIESGLPELPKNMLPKGEAPEETRKELAELAVHACAAGLRPEAILIGELAKKGAQEATAKILKAHLGAR